MYRALLYLIHKHYLSTKSFFLSLKAFHIHIFKIILFFLPADYYHRIAIFSQLIAFPIIIYVIILNHSLLIIFLTPADMYSEDQSLFLVHLLAYPPHKTFLLLCSAVFAELNHMSFQYIDHISSPFHH